MWPPLIQIHKSNNKMKIAVLAFLIQFSRFSNLNIMKKYVKIEVVYPVVSLDADLKIEHKQNESLLGLGLILPFLDIWS